MKIIYLVEGLHQYKPINQYKQLNSNNCSALELESRKIESNTSGNKFSKPLDLNVSDLVNRKKSLHRSIRCI